MFEFQVSVTTEYLRQQAGLLQSAQCNNWGMTQDADHVWLQSDTRWILNTAEYRSSAWAAKHEAQRVLDGGKFPWHGGKKREEAEGNNNPNPYPRENQWLIFDFGEQQAELSAFRVTFPCKKNEWINSEIKDYTWETGPELSGPWTPLTKGTMEQTKEPHEIKFDKTLGRYFRLYCHNAHGYTHIVVQHIEFFGQVIGGQHNVPVPKTPRKTPRNRDRNRNSPSNRTTLPMDGMKAEVSRPDSELLEMIQPIIAGTELTVTLSDLNPYERSRVQTMSTQQGLNYEIKQENATYEEGGKPAQMSFRVFRAQAGDEWQLPAADPRILLFTLHAFQVCPQLVGEAGVSVWASGPENEITEYRIQPNPLPDPSDTNDDDTELEEGEVAEPSGPPTLLVKVMRRGRGTTLYPKQELRGCSGEDLKPNPDMPANWKINKEYNPGLFNTECIVSKIQGALNKLCEENRPKLFQELTEKVATSCAWMRSPNGSEIILAAVARFFMEREYKEGDILSKLCVHLHQNLDRMTVGMLNQVKTHAVEQLADTPAAAVVANFEDLDKSTVEAQELGRRFLRALMNQAGQTFSEKPTREEQLEGLTRRNDPDYPGNKRRHHALGLMHFVADLHSTRLMKSSRLQMVLDQLYGPECKPDEWDVERLCILLSKIGNTLVQSQYADDRLLSYRSLQKLEHVSAHCVEWFEESKSGKRLEVVTEQIVIQGWASANKAKRLPSAQEEDLKKKMKPTPRLHVCSNWPGSTGRSQPFLGNRGDTPRDRSGRPLLRRTESSGPGRERDRDRDTPRGRPQMKLLSRSNSMGEVSKDGGGGGDGDGDAGGDDGGWQTAGSSRNNRQTNQRAQSAGGNRARPTLTVNIDEPNSSPKDDTEQVEGAADDGDADKNSDKDADKEDDGSSGSDSDSDSSEDGLMALAGNVRGHPSKSPRSPRHTPHPQSRDSRTQRDSGNDNGGNGGRRTPGGGGSHSARGRGGGGGGGGDSWRDRADRDRRTPTGKGGGGKGRGNSNRSKGKGGNRTPGGSRGGGKGGRDKPRR